MIISPHTFELSLVLLQPEYEALRLAAYAKAEGSHKMFRTDSKSDYYDVHIDKALASNGIRIEYHDRFLRPSIRFIVNPSKVLGGDDIPKLWKPTDRNIKTLLRDLNVYIKDYFDFGYKLKDFKVTRVDITANIYVGSREDVSLYIKILHNMGKVKGLVPNYKKSNKRIDKALSFDLKGKSSGIEISIYDKEAQSGSKEAKGILRAEIRLMLRGGDSVSKEIKHLSKNSRDIFMKFFQRIIPRGDYYKKDEAMKLIEDNIATIVPDKRAKVKMLERMMRLLELIPLKKSLHLAQKELKYRHIDRVMKAFAELNISPVTISKNMKLKYLKSLYSYLED